VGPGFHGKSLRYIFTSGAIKAVGVPLVRPFVRSFVRRLTLFLVGYDMDRTGTATILIVVYSSSPYNIDG